MENRNSEILFFLGEHMDALPLYEKLKDQILSRIPDVKIRVAKTQITFANKRGFAFVSFNPCRKEVIIRMCFRQIGFDYDALKKQERMPLSLHKKERGFRLFDLKT